MVSGCLADDGKTAVSYRGIENIFGNVSNWIDGINIQDGQAYVCYDSDSYAGSVYEDPYEKLGYVNSTTGDSYITKMGYDEKHPAIFLPIEVGGGSTTYYCDYYTYEEGDRVARVGGFFSGDASVGLWYWCCHNKSYQSYYTNGARLLKTS